MKEDKTCVICGKAYKYCQSCPYKYNTTETWRNIFCSENCRELYHVYDQLKVGQITDKNAAKSLKKLDISYLSKLNEPMKSVLALAIHDVEKKSEPYEVPEEKEADNNIDTDIPVESNRKIRSKRRNKKNNEVG